MARPRKGEKKRTIRVALSLDPEERDLLMEAMAAEGGDKLSVWAREVLLARARAANTDR
jgi:hypothetical protein